MTYGSVSFLFMGDSNADAENRIANSGANLQADILKVGHHGSATSTSTAFLSKAQSKTNVIEVGAGNSYGHPTSATLDLLAQVESAVYCTDLNGDVTVTTDGTTYDVKTGQARSQLVSGSVKTVTPQQLGEFAGFSRSGLRLLLQSIQLQGILKLYCSPGLQ